MSERQTSQKQKRIAEMQAMMLVITQVAIKVEVKAMTKVEDLAEGSVGRSTAGNASLKADKPYLMQSTSN